MFFPSFTSAATTADPISTIEAIKCVLAYTHGLEDCQIEVEVVDGSIMLAGTASSEEAACAASAIAADLTSRPLLCGLRVAPTSKLA